MEDGIERSMSFLVNEMESKQKKNIVTLKQPAKYEEQIHPIGLSLISPTNTSSGSSQHISTPSHQSATADTQIE